MAEPASGGRPIRTFLIILAFLALLGLVLWQAAPRLARRGLLLAAGASGLEPRSLEVRRVGWRRIEIADVVLGAKGDLRIGAITATYKLRDLPGLHLESVRLSDLQARARLEREGLAPGVLATLLAGEGGGTIRCDALVIEAGLLDLESPLGRARVRFEARGALPGAGEVEGEARFTLGEGTGAIRGSLRGARGPRGLQLRASLRADEERLSADLAFGPTEAAPPGGPEGRTAGGGAFPAGRGTLRLAARGANLPGIVSDLRMDGGFDLSVEPAGARLWSPAGVAARAAALDGGLLERLSLPPEIHEALAGEVEITVAASAAEAPLLQLEAREGRWRVAWGVAAKGRAGRSGALDVDARGSAELAREGDAAPRIALSPLDVRARGWTLPGARIEGAAVHLEGEGTPASFKGDLRASVRGSTGAIEALGDLPVEVSLQGPVSLVDGTLRLTPEHCVAVNLGALRLRDAGTVEPLALCLEPATDAPLLALGNPQDGWRAIALDASLRAAPLRILSQGRLADLGLLEGETPAVTIAVDGNLPRAVRFRLEGKGGRLLAPGPGVMMRDVRLDLAGSLSGDPGLKGTWSLREIAGVGKPAPLAPVGLSGTIATANGEIIFSAALGNPNGTLSLKVSGTHDLESGKGSARIALAPIHFAQGKLRPQDLLPALGRRVEGARGSLDASGTFRWGRGFFETPLRVRLKGLSYETEGIAVEGLQGDLRLRRLLPPESAPEQVLSFRRAESGVALTAGRVVFGITEAGRVEIGALEGTTLGGALTGSGWVDLKGAEGKIGLRVAGLQLADLLELIDLEGLTGSGEMDGGIPIEISARRIFVRGARFEGTGGEGWIRYRPRERPGFLPGGDERVQLMLAILDDFRYDSLGLGLDGPLFQQVDLAVDVSGSNPAVEAGRPVVLHLRVNGYLLALLRGATASTRISESLGKRLRDSGPPRGE